MILIKNKALNIMPYNVIWFADKPPIGNFLHSYYKQSSYCGMVAGYYRKSFFTKVIDIRADTAVLEAGFDQNTTYEIRRAKKDGIITAVETDLSAFITFYNLFAETKKLPMLNSAIHSYGSNIVITKAIYQDEDIVMHAYLVDDYLKRARLLYSASHFRNQEQTYLKAVTGRANRLLHFTDMCLFKQKGLELYDLGGYACKTKNAALLRINQFKDSFGGKLVKESDYLPILALVYQVFSKILRYEIGSRT